jgi:TonB family protein
MNSLLRLGALIAFGLTALAAPGGPIPIDRDEFFRHIDRYQLPTYPEKSAAERRTGTVTAVVQVDLKGLVSSVDVMVPPDPQMAAAVRQTLSDWKFRPFNDESGKPRIVKCTIHVLFRMASDGPGVVIPGLTKLAEIEYKNRR